MEQFFLDVLTPYGLPGAVIGVLGWLYVSERKDNKANQAARQRRENERKDKRIAALEAKIAS